MNIIEILEKLNANDSTLYPENVSNLSAINLSISHNNDEANSTSASIVTVNSQAVCMNDDLSIISFHDDPIEVFADQNSTNEDQEMDFAFYNKISENLFSSSNITVDKAVSHLLNSYVKHRKTKACLIDDLRIIKQILPQCNRMPSTVYKLFQYVLVFVPSCKILKHFCCYNCQYYCGVERSISCPACNFDEQFISFYELDIIGQLQFMFEKRNLAELLDAAETLRHRDANIIADITDGSEHKRVNTGRGKYDITLILSTDGACLKKSSKNSLWPVSFMIAEVPTRFRRIFMLCASVWYADKKPEMNTPT